MQKLKIRDLLMIVNENKNINLAILNNNKTKIKLLRTNEILEKTNNGLTNMNWEQLDLKKRNRKFQDYRLFAHIAKKDGKEILACPLITCGDNIYPEKDNYDYPEIYRIMDRYDIHEIQDLLIKILGLNQHANHSFTNDNIDKIITIQDALKIEKAINNVLQYGKKKPVRRQKSDEELIEEMSERKETMEF